MSCIFMRMHTRECVWMYFLLWMFSLCLLWECWPSVTTGEDLHLSPVDPLPSTPVPVPNTPLTSVAQQSDTHNNYYTYVHIICLCRCRYIWSAVCVCVYSFIYLITCGVGGTMTRPNVVCCGEIYTFKKKRQNGYNNCYRYHPFSLLASAAGVTYCSSCRLSLTQVWPNLTKFQIFFVS